MSTCTCFSAAAASRAMASASVGGTAASGRVVVVDESAVPVQDAGGVAGELFRLENQRVDVVAGNRADLDRHFARDFVLPRFGVDGAIAHLKGRGDFVSIFVLDLAPGAKTSPQKHMFEEVVYVLSGYGSTTIETSDGRKHSFEWGPKSLFALPLNARYQHFNTSGRERARLASVNNLCLQDRKSTRLNSSHT